MSEDDETGAIHLPGGPAPGDPFYLWAPASMTLDDVRQLIVTNLGFDGYIVAKFGPARFEGDNLRGEMVAVDRDTLGLVTVSTIMSLIISSKGIMVGWYCYVGTLKQKTLQ